MKKRFTALAAAFFVFVASFSAYADPVASPAEPEIESVDIQNESYVPSWSEAVQAVKDSRAAASASEAEIMTLELDDEDYGVSLASSASTYALSSEGLEYVLVAGVYDSNNKLVSSRVGTRKEEVDDYVRYSFPKLTSGFKYGRVYYEIIDIPSFGTYGLSAFFREANVGLNPSTASNGAFIIIGSGSDYVSTEWTDVRTALSNNGSTYSVLGNVVLDRYVKSVNVGFYFSSFLSSFDILVPLSNPVAFSFSSQGEITAVPSSSASSDGQGFQNEVSYGLSSIGDTLEEIVATISLQLEALWNQMYNYIHLPEYEKLEQIRQAIENIRLDVDVDNQDVVNKLDEQISNDNANREQIINGYDSSASDTAESELDAALDIGKDSESEAMNSDAVNSFKEFEFPVPSENPPAVINACLFVGNYLQRLYTAIGIFNIPIDVSLVLIIAMLVIGFYRVRMRG